MRYEIAVDIDATPEKVWEVLSDVERWHEWTDSVNEVVRLDDGPFGAGSKARVRQPRLLATVWTVTDFNPGRDFTWAAKGPGVNTVAGHEITARAGSGVTVRLSIEQTGALGSLIGIFTAGLTRRYVTMEAEGLKRRSES